MGKERELKKQIKEKDREIEEQKKKIEELAAELKENNKPLPEEPIDVAKFLIEQKIFYTNIFGCEMECEKFDLPKLKQIAEHLLVFVNNQEIRIQKGEKACEERSNMEI